jgi:hypothetical protein
MQLRSARVKSILIETGPEIGTLTKELDISLNPKAVRKIISLGMDSLNQEVDLERALKKLEEEKGCLASNFRKIASQNNQLESKYVGTRSQFGRVSRDNQVLAMHLCARSSRSKQEGQLRDEFIQKYIMNYRKT